MKKMKKWISLLVVSAMLCGLSGCGDKTGDDKKKEDLKATDPSLAKECVFRPQELDLGIKLDNLGFYDMKVVDDKVIIVVEDWSGALFHKDEQSTTPDDTPVALPEVASAVMEVEKVDIAIDGDMVIDGVMEPVDFEYYGPAYGLITVNMDGTDVKVTELKADMSQNGWISNWNIVEDGSVIAMRESWSQVETDNPEEWVEEISYDVMKWDAQGNQQWSVPLETEENEYLYLRDVILSNNEILLLTETKIIRLDDTGKQIGDIKLNDQDQFYVALAYVTDDGKLQQVSYNNEYTKTYLSELDLQTGEIGEKKELPIDPMKHNVNGASNGYILISDQTGMFKYKPGDAEPVKFLDYVNSDLPVYTLNNVCFINDKEFIATYNDMADYKLSLSKFVYVAPENIPDKVTLLLACDYMDSSVKKDVIKFNKSNDKYRITMMDYSIYNDNSSEELIPGGYTKMNNDIISGKIPDIMVFTSNPDISSWANKGLLADIGELIAKDEELSKQEYLDNVFKAMHVNDKQYTLIPYFAVSTMVARKDMVGDRTGWTMSEMQQFLKTLPEDVKPYDGDYVRETMLYYVMQFCGDDFVDINTGKCNFDSQEFIEILEFVKTLPEEIEYSDDYWENYDWMEVQDMFRNKKAIMMSCNIYDFKDLVSEFHGRLGDEPCFVGFPGVSGNSSVIMPVSSVFAISAKSENQEGAWQFVRQYLTEEYQTGDDFYGLPILKSAFVEKAKSATQKPYWIDEVSGEKTEYDYTYWGAEEEVILDPFTQKEVDDICNFIYSIEKGVYYNPYITNIVNEEAGAFFKGQKTAKDVVQVIQSRVQVYVDENR